MTETELIKPRLSHLAKTEGELKTEAKLNTEDLAIKQRPRPSSSTQDFAIRPD